MKEVELTAGTIRYRDTGSGPPIVLIHGLLVDGTLWRKVVPQLEGQYRCLVPDLPLGSHTVAMKPDADLSPPGIAAVIGEFLEKLDLTGVTLVASRYVGHSYPVVQEQLTALGLKPQRRTVISTRPADTVISLTPSGLVPPGSTVTVTVAAPKPPAHPKHHGHGKGKDD